MSSPSGLENAISNNPNRKGVFMCPNCRDYDVTIAETDYTEHMLCNNENCKILLIPKAKALRA